jgi:hypothetical protein
VSSPVRVAPPSLIAAPPAKPPAAGLLSLAIDATPNDSRWLAGYSYRPELPANVAHNRSPVTATVGANIGAGIDPPLIDTIPWELEIVDVNSTLDMNADDLAARSRRILEAYTSMLLERELWTGEIAIADSLPNRYLQRASTTNITPGTLPPPQTAVALLMDALTDSGVGDGMIHCAKAVGIRLPDAWRNQQTFQDHGFVVVSGAGYPGTGPTGQAGPNWVYATAMVNVRLGPIDVGPGDLQSNILVSKNEVTYRAQRFGATDFAGPVFACQVSA